MAISSQNQKVKPASTGQRGEVLVDAVPLQQQGFRRLRAGDVGDDAGQRLPFVVRLDLPLGQIRPGYLADLLLVNGDPTTDITVLQDPNRLFAVMKNGAFRKPPRTQAFNSRP